MEKHYNCFTQIENPKVKIGGIRDIRNYLGEKVPTFNGAIAVKFTTETNEVHVHTFHADKLKLQKHFFGYIEDIALNIQNGFYEEVEVE